MSVLTHVGASLPQVDKEAGKHVLQTTKKGAGAWQVGATFGDGSVRAGGRALLTRI